MPPRHLLFQRWPHAALVLLLTVLVSSLIQAETPVYRDKNRGVRKQREAADEAAKVVREGVSRAGDVLDLLADPSAWVRDRVVSEVQSGWSDDDRKQLVKGLQDRRPLVVEGVAEIFGKKPLPGAGKAMTAALSRAREETAEVLLWALGQSGEEQYLKSLKSYFDKRKKSARLRVAALDAIHQLSAEEGAKLAAKALEDKLLPVRGAALDRADTSAALVGVASWLENPPKSKRVGADALLQKAARWTRQLSVPADHRDALVDVIGAAIGQLEKFEGRTQTDWVKALEELTGQTSMGTDVVRWKAWWNQRKADWQPGSDSDASDSGKRSQTKVLQFHGLTVDSERLVFLHDLSGGMSRNLEGDWGDQAGKTRLDYAKAELARVLKAVPKDSWLNVVFFASEFISFKNQPQLVKKARRKILSFVADQQIPSTPHSNRGNLYDSLVFVTRQPHVDTVFLFTEGAPTEGKYIDYDRFLDHYARVLRVHPIRVHVLSLGRPSGRNRSFLERLAELTDGEYREVTGRDEG